MRPFRIPGLLALPALLAAALAPAPAAAQTTQEGWLHLVWEVPGPQREAAVTVHALFTDDGGRTVEVELPEGVARPHGGALALDRKRVALTLDRPAAREGTGEAPARVLDVRPLEAVAALRADGGPMGAVQAGSKAYVTILCRLPDVDTLPYPAAHYQALLTGSARPGLDHYWRELSDGRVNLSGSTVVGWLDLPQPTSYYFPSGLTQNPVFQRLVNDCTAVADAQVNFSQFTGVNMQFNVYAGASWGGSARHARDGVTALVPTTWMASWAGQSVYAHEMGHSFGLPHSSGPYADTYDSQWDVMSETYILRDPTYRWIGQHTMGWHKDILGWIDAARRYVPQPLTRQTIHLERSARPGSTGHLLVSYPVPGGGGELYTVEARNRNDYDAPIPGAAVVIHRVRPWLADRAAQVVDADGDGDPNDEGAMWLPGETWTHAATGLNVTVDSATATGFTVTVAVGYAVRVQVQPGGRVAGSGSFGADCTGGTCTRMFPAAGTSVTLTATPDAGKALQAWSGACASVTGSTCTVQTAVLVQAGAAFADPLAVAGAAELPQGGTGMVYADSLRATGGAAHAWQVVAGQLPPGITLGEGGALGGTPTAVGTYTFTARVASGVQRAEQAYTLQVLPGLSISTAAQRPVAVVGTAHADSLRAEGGTGTYAWTVQEGALPPGLALDGATGVVSGTPTAGGTFTATVRVSSAGLRTAVPFTFVVAPALEISSAAARRGGVMGAAYADTLQAAGGAAPIAWSLVSGALPEGVALGAGGVLSGVPAASGSFTFTARATSGTAQLTREFTLAVTRPTLPAQGVLDQLLGGAALSADAQRFLDLLGNRNGRVDVGDVRAWLVTTGGISTEVRQQLEQIVGPTEEPAGPEPRKENDQ
jgi:M6 family metalloprotease-like protein